MLKVLRINISTAAIKIWHKTFNFDRIILALHYTNNGVYGGAPKDQDKVINFDKRTGIMLKVLLQHTQKEC